MNLYLSIYFCIKALSNLCFNEQRLFFPMALSTFERTLHVCNQKFFVQWQVLKRKVVRVHGQTYLMVEMAQEGEGGKERLRTGDDHVLYIFLFSGANLHITSGNIGHFLMACWEVVSHLALRFEIRKEHVTHP